MPEQPPEFSVSGKKIGVNFYSPSDVMLGILSSSAPLCSNSLGYQCARVIRVQRQRLLYDFIDAIEDFAI